MRTKEFIAAQLSKCLDHPHWWVRRSALQSAGRLQIVRTAPQIAKCLRDTEFLVRRNACLCVAQLCKFDEVTSPDVLRQLSLLVDDDDRYNRLYATEAMQRVAQYHLRKMPSLKRLFQFLLTSRFDSDGRF